MTFSSFRYFESAASANEKKEESGRVSSSRTMPGVVLAEEPAQRSHPGLLASQVHRVEKPDDPDPFRHFFDDAPHCSAFLDILRMVLPGTIRGYEEQGRPGKENPLENPRGMIGSIEQHEKDWCIQHEVSRCRKDGPGWQLLRKKRTSSLPQSASRRASRSPARQAG